MELIISTDHEIPRFHLESKSADLGRGSEGWARLCKRVREACEEYGCFEVTFDKIPLELKQESFKVLKGFFELPLETKQKNVSPKPYFGYLGPNPNSTLYESFGIDHATDMDSVHRFANLMWPDDQDDLHNRAHFSKTIQMMMKHLEELNNLISLMIVDSYGLGEKMESMMPYYTLMRGMKYNAPLTTSPTKGLDPHSDKLSSVLLCQEEVSGLQIQTKDGHWLDCSPTTPTSFFFLVGDPLMAWSNGRMHAVRHRVMMSGDKDRYSFGAFAAPVEGTVVRSPDELIDNQHPHIFKDFDYMDFLHFSFTAEAWAIDSTKQLKAFLEKI